jgi:hypothetical protein
MSVASSFGLASKAHRDIVAKTLERCRRGPTAGEREAMAAAFRREIEAQQKAYAVWLNWLLGVPKDRA